MGTYRNFAQQALTAYLTGKTIKALLVKSTYVYDEDTHVYLSDITATGTEVAAGGYSRQTLSGVSVSYSAATGVFITAADINFGTFTQAGVLGPIFYVDTGTPSTSELLCGDVEGSPVDLTNAVSSIYRIDPAQGFLIARL